MSFEPRRSPATPTTVEEFADALAALCDEGANVILSRMGTPSADSAANDEAKIWDREFKSDLPFRWVNEVASVYLTECGHLMRSIASLYRERTVFVSLDPLVRAVIERVGRVNWVLDHRITARQRAIRSALEVAVSWQFYRKGLARLGADEHVRKVFRAKARAHLQQMETWFDVTKPPCQPCDEHGDPSDATTWSIEGQRFPTMTRLSQLALEAGEFGDDKAAGVYDALSGFSHPSVITSGEIRHIGPDGQVLYFIRAVDLDKAVRNSLFSYFDAVRHWIGYYAPVNGDDLMASMDEIASRFDELSESIPEDRTEGEEDGDVE